MRRLRRRIAAPTARGYAPPRRPRAWAPFRRGRGRAHSAAAPLRFLRGLILAEVGDVSSSSPVAMRMTWTGLQSRRRGASGIWSSWHSDRLMFNGMLSQTQKMRGAFPMSDARCSCGTLALSLPGPSNLVVACRCTDCQGRTGAPFGVGAFYPVEVVTISGTPKQFTRASASGGKVHTYFCPNCGSTVYWKADNLPALIGVAVGALADPKYPAPVRSIFEQSKHAWVQIDDATVEHFQQSSVPKTSN
jgi:hypothetical protein